MARNVMTMTVASFAFLCSSLLFGEQTQDQFMRNEIRDIKRMLAEVNTRVQQLEERMADTHQGLDPAEARDADAMWQLFGVRLEAVKAAGIRDAAIRFRGGMRVVSLRPRGPAAGQRIREGDIIVGIHVWETANENNVDFVLASEAIRGSKVVKFFVLRDGDTYFTHLEPERF